MDHIVTAMVAAAAVHVSQKIIVRPAVSYARRFLRRKRPADVYRIIRETFWRAIAALFGR